METRLMLLTMVASCFMVSCSNPIKNYVYNELPLQVWQDQLFPASVNAECSRVVSEMEVLSKALSDSLSAEISKTWNLRRDGFLAASNPYNYMCSDWKKLTASIDKMQSNAPKYKKHSKTVISDLQNSVKSVFKDTDSPIAEPSLSFSDKAICDLLLGKPMNIAAPTPELVDSVATAIVEKCASQTSIPKVTYFEYDKQSKIYHVRFDCADPLYFRAYKRNDGTYEYEFVSEEIASSYSSEGRKSVRSGKSNWDKVLDDYEKYVNQLISLYQKIENGDEHVMDSYAKLLDKLEPLNNDLEDAKGEMTASQMNRYLNITQKLSTSISDF